MRESDARLQFWIAAYKERKAELDAIDKEMGLVRPWWEPIVWKNRTPEEVGRYLAAAKLVRDAEDRIAQEMLRLHPVKPI